MLEVSCLVIHRTALSPVVHNILMIKETLSFYDISQPSMKLSSCIPRKVFKNSLNIMRSTLKVHWLLLTSYVTTSTRIQRLWLQRAPGYNKHFFLSEKMTSDWHQCLESSVNPVNPKPAHYKLRVTNQPSAGNCLIRSYWIFSLALQVL